MGMQTMNLHEIAGIELGEVEELTNYGGKKLYTRDVKFVPQEGSPITITAFSYDKASLAVKQDAE